LTFNAQGPLRPKTTGAAAKPADQRGATKARFLGDRLVLVGEALFLDEAEAARRLIDRAFALADVRSVVVRRDHAQIAIELSPLADPLAVWRRLGGLLQADGGAAPGRAARLDLAGPAAGLPVRVTRAGKILTTFRARVLSPEHIRIGHPLLRQRDVRARFEELIRSIHGVVDVRMVGLSSSAHVVYDPALIEAEQLLRLLEGAWPDLVGGPLLAATPKKLAVAGGLLALSFYAQFFNPVLLPWATAAVVLYSLPNLIAAIRDLARGRIGLPALYSAGLGFLLWTRLPFASSVMSVLTQLWPALANRLAAGSERGLFAERRRRLAWARVSDAERGEIQVEVEDLAPGATVLVRAGDYIPVDGLVVDGAAAVDEDMLTGARGAFDKIAGDRVHAGTFVRDGELVIRAVRAGSSTGASALAHALPHGALRGLPSSVEVERIANRNARPALAAAALLLLATRTPRLAQVVIRPDYATAPRLSAHLSGLTALAESLAAGVLIRRPAALDRLLGAEVFLFDDGLDFAAREVELAKINVVARAAADEALALAAAALAGRDDPRAEALRRELAEDGARERAVQGRRQRAGETTFWDETGALVSVASPDLALRENFAAPSAALHELLHRLALDPPEPGLRPLVVARDRTILGILQFARSGARRYARLVAALRAQNPDARFVHLSSDRQDVAEARSDGLGLDAVFGGLDADAKREALRSLGMRAAWIGKGADPASAPLRAASAVSLSLGGLDSLAEDDADIVLLRDDLGALLTLRAAAEAHAGRLRSDYRTVYLANLAAIAGGFAAGFGSLQAGLTSNLGSALVFLGRWRQLSALSARAERIAQARRSAAGALAAPAPKARLSDRRVAPARRARPKGD
jgi:cation transport ATPase